MNKLTDSEIINCLNDTEGKEDIGIYCTDKNGNFKTVVKLTDLVDLLNRQKAKIEFLKEQRDIYMKDATEFSKKIERLSNLVNEKNVINKWLLKELKDIAETESD